MFVLSAYFRLVKFLSYILIGTLLLLHFLLKASNHFWSYMTLHKNEMSHKSKGNNSDFGFFKWNNEWYTLAIVLIHLNPGECRWLSLSITWFKKNLYCWLPTKNEISLPRYVWSIFGVCELTSVYILNVFFILIHFWWFYYKFTQCGLVRRVQMSSREDDLLHDRLL